MSFHSMTQAENVPTIWDVMFSKWRSGEQEGRWKLAVPLKTSA